MKQTMTFVLQGASGEPVTMTVTAGLIADGTHGVTLLNENKDIVAFVTLRPGVTRRSKKGHCSAMPNTETPQFRVSNAGEPIPPVDPVALKGSCSTRKEPLTCGVVKPAQREEAAG